MGVAPAVNGCGGRGGPACSPACPCAFPWVVPPARAQAAPRERSDAPQETDAVARAALLSKTDLVTEMIRDGKEFTALQGVMGRAYALENGESEAVALALEERTGCSVY